MEEAFRGPARALDGADEGLTARLGARREAGALAQERLGERENCGHDREGGSRRPRVDRGGRNAKREQRRAGVRDARGLQESGSCVWTRTRARASRGTKKARAAKPASRAFNLSVPHGPVGLRLRRACTWLVIDGTVDGSAAAADGRVAAGMLLRSVGGIAAARHLVRRSVPAARHRVRHGDARGEAVLVAPGRRPLAGRARRLRQTLAEADDGLRHV